MGRGACRPTRSSGATWDASVSLHPLAPSDMGPDVSSPLPERHSRPHTSPHPTGERDMDTQACRFTGMVRRHSLVCWMLQASRGLFHHGPRIAAKCNRLPSLTRRSRRGVPPRDRVGLPGLELAFRRNVPRLEEGLVGPPVERPIPPLGPAPIIAGGCTRETAQSCADCRRALRARGRRTARDPRSKMVCLAQGIEQPLARTNRGGPFLALS